MKQPPSSASSPATIRPRAFVAVLGLASALVALTHSVRAEACSCVDEAVNEVQTGDGDIPANAGGIVWWFNRGYVRTLEDAPREPVQDVAAAAAAALQQLNTLVSLQRWDGAAFQNVATQVESFDSKAYLIRPAEPWSAGERYRLGIDAGTEYAEPPTRTRVSEFEIVPALQPDPNPQLLALEELQAGPLPFMVGDGSCGATRDAVYIDIDFPTPEGAENWPRELLLYDTYVDGDHWSHFTSFCDDLEPGSSWFSRTGDRLIAKCDERKGGRGLSRGSHQVRMEARLAGTDLVFSTEVVNVELYCPTPVVRAAEEPPEDGCALSSPLGSSPAPVRAALGLALALAALIRRRRWMRSTQPRATLGTNSRRGADTC